MLIQQQEPIAMLTRSHPSVGNPVHQLAGDRLRLSMGISLVLSKHMPNGDQQFAGDGHNRFLFADPPGQSFKLGFPMRMMVHRAASGFDHHSTHIPSAFFGDMSPLSEFPRSHG